MQRITYWLLMLLPLLFSCNKKIETEKQIPTASMGSKQKIGESPFYYYYKGKKQRLELNTDYAFVSATTPIFSQKGTIIEGHSVIKSGRDTRLGKKMDTQPKEIYWAELKLGASKTEKDYFTDLESLSKKQDVETVAPSFKTSTNKKIRLSNGFYVKLKSDRDFSKLKDLADSNDVVILGQNKFMPLWYTLSVTKRSKKNALEMANFFYETELFDHAEPDLIPDNLGTSDPYYPVQWNLSNTGQYGGTSGIDIKLSGVHAITKGAGVVVAVVDDGVQLNHPDLSNNIYSQSFDAMSGTSPSVVYGAHGTPCAGVIAADDNSIGVLGIAPDSKIMSASVDWHSGTYVQERFADAINWSWQHGADVISNSWEGGTPTALLDDAISDALTSGRGGKGCVVVFSSGNGNNSSISYPANKYSDLLVVGAINYCGQRKNPSSCDGEPWGGSSYGTNLDIVAPGVRVPSTYLVGTGDGGTDYSIWFNGTSAAAPHAAGVAALVLAMNPDLTQGQVSTVIEATAQKAGSYTYSNYVGRRNGSWNQDVGHGLLSAMAAVTGVTNCSLTSWVDFKSIDFAFDGTTNRFSMDFTGNGNYVLEYWVVGNGPYFGQVSSGIIHNFSKNVSYEFPGTLILGNNYVFDCIIRNECGEERTDPWEFEFEFIE